jgi:hypothetical protein
MHKCPVITVDMKGLNHEMWDPIVGTNTCRNCRNCCRDNYCLGLLEFSFRNTLTVAPCGRVTVFAVNYLLDCLVVPTVLFT